jgi:hypothetical protein
MLPVNDDNASICKPDLPLQVRVPAKDQREFCSDKPPFNLIHCCRPTPFGLHRL